MKDSGDQDIEVGSRVAVLGEIVAVNEEKGVVSVKVVDPETNEVAIPNPVQFPVLGRFVAVQMVLLMLGLMVFGEVTYGGERAAPVRFTAVSHEQAPASIQAPAKQAAATCSSVSGCSTSSASAPRQARRVLRRGWFGFSGRGSCSAAGCN